MDETLSERLWGLTEMFPETLVNFSCKVTNHTKTGVKGTVLRVIFLRPHNLTTHYAFIDIPK